MFTNDQIWNELDPTLRAEIHAGKHPYCGALHRLRIEILADEAETRVRRDAYSDVLNKARRWMD